MNSKNHSKISPTHHLDKLSARDKKFLDQIAKQFIIGHFANGELTDKDLSLPTEKFIEKIKALSDRSDIKFIIDHRDRLLAEADYFFAKQEFELAKIMFAMFFEHSINGLISNYCTKKRFDEKTQVGIIKSIDIHGKLTWLLKVFEFPLFNETHKKTIKKVAEDRNAFIHYKWKAKEEEDDYKSNLHIDEFKEIRQATVYMKYYETKVKFNKNKSKIENRLKIK